MNLPPTLPRLAAANLLVATLYGLLAAACLSLTMIEPHVSPLWLPAGLALAVVIWHGPTLLPGLWLGYTASNMLIQASSWPVATLCALGGVGSAWLGATLFRRWLPGGLIAHPEAPGRFVILAYACTAPAGLWGPLVTWLAGALPQGSLDATIIVWWLGDALGMLVLAPPLLLGRELLAARRAAFRFDLLAMLGLVATVILVLLSFVANIWFLPNPYLQAVLLLPPMMWLTARSQPAVSLALNFFAATSFAYAAAGPLGPQLGTTPLSRVYALHGFILVGSATLLYLAAHIHRVGQLATAARRGEERFERLTRLTSDWYWEQDAELRFLAPDEPSFGMRLMPSADVVGRRRWEIPGIEPHGRSWDAHRADLAARRPFVGLVLRYAPTAKYSLYYSVSGEPVFDDKGAFAGYRGVGRVVTAEIESRQALLESEQQFHGLADATFEGVLVHDFGRLVFANQALAHLLGRSVDDLVGRSMLEFTVAEEQAQLISHLTRNESARSTESIAVTADGRRLPVEIFSRPFVFQGKLLRIAAVRDISRHRATEAALAARLALQRKLFDTIPSPIFYKDCQGRYLGYNRAFATSFGVGAEELIGKTAFDLLPENLGQQLQAGDDLLFANPGIQVHDAPLETIRGWRQMMIRKDVFMDDQGQAAGLLGILIDVTARKKFEERLRRYQELLPTAVGILDTNGKMLHLNASAIQLFGYTAAEVPTIDTWWRLAYPDPAYREDRRRAWFAALEAALREGRQMLRLDNRVHCKDGRECWVEILASIGTEEIFMIFTDLSDHLGAGNDA